MTVLVRRRPPGAGRGRPIRGTAAGLATLVGPWLVALAVIALAVRWGRRLQVIEPNIRLGAAPLVGFDKRDGWDWRFDRNLVSAAGVGLIVALAVTRSWWWRWPRGAITAFTSVAAASFATLLALADGVAGHGELLRGAEHRTEYLANLATAPPAGVFVRRFVEDIDGYSVHVRGHPPGFVLVLKLLDRVGLDGPWPVVGLSVAGAALVPVAVLAAVGAAGGDHWVRRCAPLLAVSPYALWQMTSADAVFSAVGAMGAAGCVLGLCSPGWRAWGWGSAGGALLAGLLFLTYGGALFLLVPGVPVALALWRRSRSAVLVAAGAVGAAALVTAAFAAAGFWWFDGAAETQRQYWAGTARLRPAGYFALANVAVALIAIGPGGFAGLAGLWRHRRHAPPMAALALGALVAVAGSNLSQLTKGEVERIWLLFYPWLVMCGGIVVRSERRWWGAALVGIQAAGAVTLQAALVSKW